MMKLEYTPKQLELYFILQKHAAQDSQYQLWTIISSIASVVFASLWVTFQYLKALDASNTSWKLSVASLAIAVVTNAVYHLYIIRNRSKEEVRQAGLVNSESTPPNQAATGNGNQ